ncbi:hypothetical protein J2R78_008601 [Bradyrhizobium sp. USDA 4538]|nr:hypothetical protein [Bradyrhizobium sp. USDA 4538]MCP1907111.1 hypothetical protein [Bradyrhizobium sp. USDA 4537]MCP1985586.1 hypothetical protein [Bradyrhizobium sp. USDA 4539]
MSKALSRISFGITRSPMAQAPVDPTSQIVTGGLYRLDQRDQNDHHCAHHFRHEALLTIADAEIANAATAHGSNHRRVAERAHDYEGRQLFGASCHGSLSASPMSRGAVLAPHRTTSREAIRLAISDSCADVGETSLGMRGKRRFVWRHTRHFL